jgi:hypothetical protein
MVVAFQPGVHQERGVCYKTNKKLAKTQLSKKLDGTNYFCPKNLDGKNHYHPRILTNHKNVGSSRISFSLFY